MKNLFIPFCFILFLSCEQSTKNQGESLLTIDSSFQAYESHEYFLQAASDQFIKLKIDQKGIDLVVEVFNAEGKSIGQFDSPNGLFGPEYVSFYSDMAGEYTIEVKPLNEDSPIGDYNYVFLGSEPIPVDLSERVDQLFFSYSQNLGPGAAVAVVKDGKIIHKNGYGLAQVEYDIPITPSTVFHIASVSKQVTAFAVLLLESEGKLSYEDDIRNYIPELNEFSEKITLNHLVHHTSGLRDQWNLLTMAGWRFDDVITKDHIMKLLKRQRDLNFKPGEEFLYCNSGFTLLAEVVERVSGQSFADYTKEKIFQPLGMDNTLFYDDHERIVKNRAYSYGYENGQLEKRVLSYANVGATSMFTTAEDLSKWAMNFEKPVVGSEEIIEKMEEPFILNSGDTTSYGYGQGIGKYKGLKSFAHGGADAGYRTYLGRFPEQGFSIIVFSNDATFSGGSIAGKIADIYLKDEFTEVPEEETDTREDDSENTTEIDLEVLKKYVGVFELQPGFIIEFTLDEEGKFYGQATGQSKFLLIPETKTLFEVKGLDAKVRFEPMENGKIDKATLLQGGENPLRRLPPFDGSKVELTEYEGKYYSEELDTYYSFEIKNDTLTAIHNRHPDIKLSPSKANMFSGDRWFFGGVEIVRNNSGSVSGIRISNGRVRDLKFQKIE